jgi:hypothetical protein
MLSIGPVRGGELVKVGDLVRRFQATGPIGRTTASGLLPGLVGLHLAVAARSGRKEFLPRMNADGRRCGGD